MSWRYHTLCMGERVMSRGGKVHQLLSPCILHLGEKSGCLVQLQSHLKRKRDPAHSFRGNRLFLLMVPVFTISVSSEQCLQHVYAAGSKALGIIDKHITGPLWRMLESGLTSVNITLVDRVY